jgi:uncharacterized delta-60 repeat protein
MRLNANGTLDTSFGNNGQVITQIPTANNGNYYGESVKAIAITSSGQILILGEDITDYTLILARYNPNGTLDTTFGNGGYITTPLTAAKGIGISLTLQPDGKIVVAGGESVTTGSGTWREGMLLRYNANGSLDTSFGNNGIVNTLPPAPAGFTAGSSNFQSLALYPSTGTANDGKLVAVGNVELKNSAGRMESLWAAVRYNPDGSLDTTFGNGSGYVILPDARYGIPNDGAYGVTIESDGKLIIVGQAYGSTINSPLAQVARLNVDGSLDTTFGNGGLVVTAIGSYNGGTDCYFDAVALQPDGRILAAGTASVGSLDNAYTLARYLASEPQIGSFTANPNPVTAGTSVTLTASGITGGNPNVTITQVAFYLDSNNDGTLETGSDTLLGNATQTSPGVWTLTNSSAFGLTAGTYKLFAQAQDSDGVFGDPVALTLTVQ